jgi:hypothetical protein
MNNLKSVLAAYAPSPDVYLGGDSKNDLPRDRLRKDLLAVSDKNKSFFYIGVAMLVILFLAALGLVWMWRDKPQLITGVFAATGVSITGIIATMFSHWKEKVRSDMLLALLSGTDDVETLKAVIGALAAKL